MGPTSDVSRLVQDAVRKRMALFADGAVTATAAAGEDREGCGGPGAGGGGAPVDGAVPLSAAEEIGLSRQVAAGRRARVAAKIVGEYKQAALVASAADALDKQERETRGSNKRPRTEVSGSDSTGATTRQELDANQAQLADPVLDQVAESIQASSVASVKEAKRSTSLVKVEPEQGSTLSEKRKVANELVRLGAPELAGSESRALSVRRKSAQVVEPKWHAPWVLKQVLAGHGGWVRCVAVDPSNRFFFTGSSDRTIKCWDLATGALKLTLTSHSHGVTGLAVSPKYPYLFSTGEDKNVLCWDLETNQVVRRYHGHLQAVQCAAVHPTLDILMTGARDASARLWDIRSRKEIHVLTGHTDTVQCMLAAPVNPQLVTGSMDRTIKLWDIAAGRSMLTLTHHKRGIRALAASPIEFAFASGSADSLKKWETKTGRLMLNIPKLHMGIVNTLSCNSSNVLFAGGDNGELHFYDWQSGHCFQNSKTTPQPGSLESEACVIASAFDVTGTRLITCEADKSIKIWRQDPSATEETHPVNWDRDAAVQRAINERF